MTEKPKTQRGMIDQLWFVVIGSNGDGLVVLLKETLKKLLEYHERLEAIEAAIPALWTKEQHEKMHAQFVEQEKARKEKEQKDRKQGDERRKMSRRELVNYIVTGVLSAAAILVLVFKK